MILLLNIILNKQKIYLARAKTIPYRFLKYLFHHKNKMIKIKLCKKKKKDIWKINLERNSWWLQMRHTSFCTVQKRILNWTKHKTLKKKKKKRETKSPVALGIREIIMFAEFYNLNYIRLNFTGWGGGGVGVRFLLSALLDPSTLAYVQQCHSFSFENIWILRRNKI